MRDAISLLDQVVSYTDKKVTVEDVHDIKGTVSNEKLIVIAEAIYKNDSVEAINQMDELITLGKESPRLVENLIKFYRDLLIFKNIENYEVEQLVYSDNKFVELTKQLSNNLIFYYIDVLNKAQQDMKWTTNAKLFMELALIKMVDQIEKQEVVIEDELQSLTEELSILKDKIHELENREPQIIEVTKTVETKDVQQPLVEEQPEKTEVAELFKADEEQTETPEEVEEETEQTEQTEDKDESIFDYEVKKSTRKDYKTFDIRFVEDVLNSANRETKIAMNKKWFDLEREVAHSDLSYAKMITEGRLVAANDDMIIIEYPNASLCNRMMKTEVREKITMLLSDYYHRTLDYLALPKAVWEEKSQEFIQKWRSGEKEISLSPINHPSLVDIPKINHAATDMTPDSVKEAVSIFGYDSVKVKKGE